MFFRLLWESFRRQRRRKALAGIAILLGTTAVTAMLALATTIGDRIHKELAVYGANIVVTPKAANLDVKIGGVDIKPATGNAYLHESDLKKLQGIFWANNITGVSPELTGEGNASKLPDLGKNSFKVRVVGLWFNKHFGSITTGASQLHPWWRLQGNWPQERNLTDYLPVVVGKTLADHLGIKVGDSFRVMTPELETAHLDNVVTVTGIVSSGDETDNEILMNLDEAQGLLNHPDAVSRVDVSARTKPEDAFARKDPDTLSPQQHEIWYCRPYANSIAYQIREAIPGAQADQVRRVEQNEGNVLERISGLMWLISAAALLAAGFAVSAAMATAILERRAEIGLMRSLGASKGSIAFLFYSETGLLAIFAGAIGYLFGSGLAAWLGARIFAGDGAATGSPILNPILLPIVVALAFLVAIAGSTPSIRTSLEMDPSTILRADA
ncbi:MAG TPA: FtsX-like permease family protein [Edaphobacter sp.]|uniref:ABC transporter permease n=1 Tax=Edaphobacter sp. TaxID=1934404 RepID=UPI002C54F2A1|nr:FtsX-like permease family protein [Edaphobacter sp.]HUZ97615.1 FtsX-like permease family protein [Edaphobacter sp.]